MRATAAFVALALSVPRLASAEATQGTDPQPGVPPADMARGPVIEAGCSFSAAQIKGGEVGSVYQVSCPADCLGKTSVWGTDMYTADSGICQAGIHAGAIPPTGGVVTVRLEAGQPAYRGSSRHGVQSSDFGSFGSSFTVLGTEGQPTEGQPTGGRQPTAGVIEAGCTLTGNDVLSRPEDRHLISCPSDCGSQSLWGTDVYTADSPICTAAIHAGLIPREGGTVALVGEPGRAAYRGSTQHGVHSSDYGSYDKSYHLERP